MAYATKRKTTGTKQGYIPPGIIRSACGMARDVVYVFVPKTTLENVEDFYAIRHCISYGDYIICPDRTLRLNIGNAPVESLRGVELVDVIKCRP